jgi:hypothetical protein
MLRSVVFYPSGSDHMRLALHFAVSPVDDQTLSVVAATTATAALPTPPLSWPSLASSPSKLQEALRHPIACVIALSPARCRFAGRL